MGRILVTGGAGFIGSALVRRLVLATDATVINVDKLTYAGNLSSLSAVTGHPRHRFEQVDITDAGAVADVFWRYRPTAVVHLAAESHVDRSIDAPSDFVRTNVLGTQVMLDAARAFLSQCDAEIAQNFRFLHVSTDEVFGSLGPTGAFDETTAYDPRSPYSASKAASDHLVRAWHHTYGLPTLITNCSNNYGPYQLPEKLMPVLILNGSAGRPLPIYGRGDNVRDWLFVEDHVDALLAVLARGRVGETYAVGGNSERSNLQVAEAVCDLLDELLPASDHRPHRALIRFVADRPGHDRRYAIDASKLRGELGWAPAETFESGLRRTVEWYLANGDWCADTRQNARFGERLGLGEARAR